MDEVFGNFSYDPYQNLAVKFERFFELNLFVLDQISFCFFLFENKIFLSARILQFWIKFINLFAIKTIFVEQLASVCFHKMG